MFYNWKAAHRDKTGGELYIHTHMHSSAPLFFHMLDKQVE